MPEKHTKFAHKLVNELIQIDNNWLRDEVDHEIVKIENEQHQLINLNLTPFDSVKCNDIAEKYFEAVKSIDGLIDVYKQIRKDFNFESDLSAFSMSISVYANEFLDTIFREARKTLLPDDVELIVNFVKNLDCYTAVKSIESLLYSHSDLELLRIAKAQDWVVHFDHLAIRCGSSANESAQQVAKLLTEQYNYSHPKIKTEKFYLFEEGWSAYPLYKVLTNGQVLRIFVDQSEVSFPNQIIQHWNQVYGFTAHHLALRITKIEGDTRVAIPLQKIIKLMTEHNREVLTPTGYYTNGLLSQVFTKPEKNKHIPVTIMTAKKVISKKLPDMLLNAKLLEIVSRKEMSSALAKQYYKLYDIEYNSKSDLHSAVYYQYFLPAQAAHVIKSSIEI